MIYRFVVTPEFDGKRLTDVLSGQLGMSASARKRIRLRGSASSGDTPLRLIDPVRAGQTVIVTDGEPVVRVEADHDLDVLFEDDCYLAVNKPAGFVTHPTVHRHAPSVLERLGSTLRAVGRLDKDTSGVLLFAKDAHSHHYAVSQPMRKRYAGFCHGVLPERRVRVDGPIRRSNQQYLRRVVRQDGKPAVTHMLVMEQAAAAGLSYVSFRLDSGRTHQIRVHALYQGNPLLGDWLYGLDNLEDIFPGKGVVSAERAAYAASLYTEQAFCLDRLISRQALHAASLTFCHPKQKQRIRLTAPLPPDLLVLKRLLSEATLDNGEDIG